MKRGLPGRYETTTVAGETVRAFVPRPLPPDPPLVLKARPLSTLQHVARRAELSFPAAAAGMAVLLELGIARELTGKRRNRVFVYDRSLALLGEGAEPFSP